MRRFVLLLAFTVASCTTSAPDDSTRKPAQPAPTITDTRLTELQVTMTELVDRFEVLSDRLQRLESGAPSQTTVETVKPARKIEVQAVPQPRPPQAAVAGTPAGTNAPVPTQNRALAGAELADKYRNALALYGKGRLDDSRRSFMEVFELDPNGELADNALYWVAETYFVTGKYSEAMKYYRRIESDYPEQNKAPDALLKVGLAYEKMSDLGLARRTFDGLIARYPYSTAAVTARSELKRIKY